MGVTTRIRSILGAAAAAVLLACGGAEPSVETGREDRPVADCGVAAEDVQVAGGVGVLRPGASVAEVEAECSVVLDTVQAGPEGMPVRTLLVALGGDSVVAEIAADTVWRLRLTSSRFRTPAGFAVGTPAKVLAAANGARVQIGEGEVYMVVAGECGVSYRIAGVDFGTVAAARSPEQALADLPDSARVDRILIWRCAPEPAA